MEREASSLIRLPLPPPEESDDGIDLEAPTLQRVPALASASGPMPVQLHAFPPQLISRRAQLVLTLLGAVAAALAVALAFG